MRLLFRLFSLSLACAIIPACGSQGSPGAAPFVPTLVLTEFLNGAIHVIATDLERTQSVDVCGAVVSGGNVRDARWSPDRAWVAFIADLHAVGDVELFVVPVSGGIPSQRSSLPDSSYTVGNLGDWSPDSAHIYYGASNTSGTDAQLHVAHLAGGTTNLSAGRISGGIAGQDPTAAWNRDSSRVAFMVFYSVAGTISTDLFISDPFGAQSAHVLDTSGFPGGQVSQYEWAPDGSALAFIGIVSSAGRELYSCRPDGSGTLTLSSPRPSVSDARFQFRWAPDSSRLLYLLDQNTPGLYELYTALPIGGNVKVSGTLVGTGSAGSVRNMAWSPDSSHVAYTAPQDVLSSVELYVSPATTAVGNVKVSGPLIANGSVGAPYWSPDSSRLAYAATQDSTTTLELYVSSSTTSAGNRKVSGPMTAGGNVERQIRILWAPDSTRLSYAADEDTDTVREVYVTTLSGSVFKGSGALGTSPGVVDILQWLPDGSRVVYEVATGSGRGTYLTRSDAGGAPQTVSTDIGYFQLR